MKISYRECDLCGRCLDGNLGILHGSLHIERPTLGSLEEVRLDEVCVICLDKIIGFVNQLMEGKMVKKE